MALQIVWTAMVLTELGVYVSCGGGGMRESSLFALGAHLGRSEVVSSVAQMTEGAVTVFVKNSHSSCRNE